MKKVLLLVLGVCFLSITNAQIVPVDGEKFRVLTDFKASKPFGKDTIVGISVTADTTGGLLIRTKQDTTAMYLHNDTAKMFTTASSWLFTPALPCCTPDTVPLFNITTQCTTVTANRWSPVIVDSFGNVSTTVCDTISYLYVDSFFSGNAFFEVGLGANSLQDVRSPNGAQSNQSTSIGSNNTITNNSYLSFTYGYLNQIYDTSHSSTCIGLENTIYSNSYESSAFGNINKIFNNSYFSVLAGYANEISDTSNNSSGFGVTNNIRNSSSESGAFGYANNIGNLQQSKKTYCFGYQNAVDNSENSLALGHNITISNTPKTIALGIYAIPTDSNQLAISDSIKTVLLKLNVATAGSGSVLTVDSNGIATWGNQTLSGSATLDFGSIGAHAYEDLTITVTGATSGDVVSLGLPNGSVPADASFFAWVSAADTVTVRCFNIDGGTIDPASGLFKVKVFK